MPLYEYKCEKCRKVHEIMQKFSDAPVSECPDCQGPVEKLISRSSFALKGSGWYTTDYKKKSQPSSGSGEDKAAAATDAPKTPSESKPEGKSESKTESAPNKTESKPAAETKPKPAPESKPVSGNSS